MRGKVWHRAKAEAYEAARGLVEAVEVEVAEVTEAMAQEMLPQAAQKRAVRRRALDTTNGGSAQKESAADSGKSHQGAGAAHEANATGLRSSHQDPVVAFDDNAKVQNNLDKLAEDCEKNVKSQEKSFLGRLSAALGLRNNGNKSNYGMFVARNGAEVRDHNSKAKNFDEAGYGGGISIVFTRKPNEGLANNGEANIVENASETHYRPEHARGHDGCTCLFCVECGAIQKSRFGRNGSCNHRQAESRRRRHCIRKVTTVF